MRRLGILDCCFPRICGDDPAKNLLTIHSKIFLIASQRKILERIVRLGYPSSRCIVGINIISDDIEKLLCNFLYRRVARTLGHENLRFSKQNLKISFNDPAKNRTWVSSKSTMRSTIRLRDLDV